MKYKDLTPFLKDFVVTMLFDIASAMIIYFLTKNLISAIITAILTAFIIALTFYLVRVIDLIHKSGLAKIHKDSPDPTPLLKQYFKRSQEIRILAIRGARMLGTDRSLINYIIEELPKSWNGKIQILLLDPASDYLEQRARELGNDPKQFALECNSAIQNVVHLKEKYNINIDIRLYNRKPILRAIIFNDRALISYYDDQGHTPIQYEIRAGEVSLLKMIDLIYDDLWLEAKSI